MTRPEPDRPAAEAGAASAADQRFWQAFAQAAGFDDELRELIAAGEIDPADLETEGPSGEDLLAADRFHALLSAARPVPVERALRPSQFGAWVAAGTLAALGTSAAIAVAVWLGQNSVPTDVPGQEIASAERLAQAWVAVRESSPEADAVYYADAVYVDDSQFIEVVDADAEASVAAVSFDETPDWLALAVAREAELATGAVEEGTP